MKKKINYLELDSVGNVLDTVLKGINLKRGMKKNTIYKFWNQVVGKKFEALSKPVNINDMGVLTIACANAAVTSELLMFKADLLKKINQYANPLGIEVTDLHFSHKISVREEIEEEIQEAEKVVLPDFNPDEFELDEDEIERIRQSVDSNTFVSKEQRASMFATIERNLKYNMFLEKNKH